MSYEYDGLGRSLTETVQSLLVLAEEATRLWDGLRVVGMDSSAFGDTTLVRDPFGDVSIQASDALLGTDVRWGLADRLGSSIGQTQGSKISQLAEYSDWGVPTFNSLGWNSEAGYTGELSDTTSGLVNFYARSYDPSAATWLSADPYRGMLSSPQSLARYQYVGNNPATDTDAFGYATNRMLRDGGGGGRVQHYGGGYYSSTGYPSYASPTTRVIPPSPKPTPASPSGASGAATAERHGEMATLLAVLDGISMIAGFAAFIPGPQQPVFAAISAITGAAATFMRCMTGGILSPDCLVDVVFALLGPIGKGLKHVIGPVVKQALGGAAAVVNRAPTPAAVNRADNAASCVAGGLKSFSGDTEVLLADGATKPIEDIEIGDEVLAADPVTGEQAAEEVTHLWVHDDDLVDLTTSAGVVTTTEDHPFWNHTDQQWQDAEDLDPGDALLTADGDTITVEGIDAESVHEGMAYNLTVDRLHTYYVKIGGEPTLVHNKGPNNTGPSCNVPGSSTQPNLNYDKKIGDQMGVRGWTDESLVARVETLPRPMRSGIYVRRLPSRRLRTPMVKMIM